MDNIDKWLEETKLRCMRFSEAYRLELSRLWWANLMFVVLPAVSSTAAAIIAAIPQEKILASFGDWILPPASILAGLAAVLVAVHKALKCDEYQAECLRLSQRYQALAESAGSALSRPDNEHATLQQGIARELKELTEGAKARLSTRIIASAKKRCDDAKLF